MMTETSKPLRYPIVFSIVAMTALLFAGCFTSVPARPEGVAVSGKVLLPNGSALSGGTLILRPEEGIYGGSAIIQPDGTYVLKDTSGVQGVVPGKYQVFVSFPNPAHNKLRTSVSPRYQNSEDGDSDVFVEIEPTIASLDIRLKR